MMSLQGLRVARLSEQAQALEEAQRPPPPSLVLGIAAAAAEALVELAHEQHANLAEGLRLVEVAGLLAEGEQLQRLRLEPEEVPEQQLGEHGSAGRRHPLPGALDERPLVRCRRRDHEAVVKQGGLFGGLPAAPQLPQALLQLQDVAGRHAEVLQVVVPDVNQSLHVVKATAHQRLQILEQTDGLQERGNRIALRRRGPSRPHRCGAGAGQAVAAAGHRRSSWEPPARGRGGQPADGRNRPAAACHCREPRRHTFGTARLRHPEAALRCGQGRPGDGGGAGGGCGDRSRDGGGSGRAWEHRGAGGAALQALTA
mmetsp:Transcript_72979/g.237275  ORF Transcript_72979/g.237275 Transcript_72979/m.237275 type:complete len:313 (+) Transcript_72979:2306-3244(+)